MKKITFIVGSLRKESFNERLAKVAEEALKGEAEITYLNPREVPMYDQDIEFPVPEEVKAVWDKVSGADAVWIFTPEYNKHVPGALKNLLDWLSRPTEFMKFDVPSVMKGKKVTLSGVGGSEANVKVRENLKDLLHYMGVETFGGIGTGFSLPMEAFVTGQWEPEEEVYEEIRKQAEVFLKEI